MALILTIDTALEEARLYLARDRNVLCHAVNGRQSDHAGWIHKAIHQLMEESHCNLQELDAIAVTSGPGSYTGLRVGMATAKGLCFALNKPLITESTLKVMAAAAYRDTGFTKWVCPMIDARRMEVFTAVYAPDLSELLCPQALILDPDSYSNFLAEEKCLFLGSGTQKWKTICRHENAHFHEGVPDLSIATNLIYTKFLSSRFTDLAYAEPQYLKEFHIRQL